jgi:hypothetical protein
VINRNKMINFLLKFWYIWITLLIVYLFNCQETVRYDWEFSGNGKTIRSSSSRGGELIDEYITGRRLPGSFIVSNPNLLLPIQRALRLPSAHYSIRVIGKGTLRMSITRNGKLCSEVNKEIDGNERVEITCIPE